MLQEKKIEPKTDSPNVLLYAIIVCVHYPLRIALVVWRLFQVAFVKILSFPKHLLVCTLTALEVIEELLEKKVTNLLTYFTKIPSNVFESIVAIVLDAFNIVYTNNPENKNQPQNSDTNSIFGYLLFVVKKLSNLLLTIIRTCQSCVLSVLLFPINISIYCLKLSKNLIYTTVNMAEAKPESDMTEKDEQLLQHVVNLYLICKEAFFNYAYWILATSEYLLIQILDISKSTIRHVYKALIKALAQGKQILLQTFLIAYHVGEIILIYFLYGLSLIIKPITDRKEAAIKSERVKVSQFEDERQRLRQEIAELKEILKTNENYNYKQEVINLQKQLSETSVKLDKERTQYKQEIEKLKQNQNDKNVQKTNNFNNERKKLQDEIQRLQFVIAEVQKESDEENKLKKQEAVNLDNERNQLQEQIQNLQQQVINLQKQNETNALNYKEAQEAFEDERNGFREEIEKLEDKITELERQQNEAAKENYSTALNNGCALKGKVRKLEAHEEVLQKHIKILKTFYEDTLDIQTDLNSEVNEKQLEKQLLEKENKLLKHDLDYLQRYLIQMERTIIAKEEDTNLGQDVNEVKQESKEKIAKMKEQFEKEIRQLIDKNASLEEEIICLKSNIESLKKAKRPFFSRFVK